MNAVDYYRYVTTPGYLLRVGDELRAADGKSWLDPIADVEVGAGRFNEVQVWTVSPTRAAPDFTFERYSKYRVRRPIVATGSYPSGGEA